MRQSPSLTDRLLAVLTYITAGMVGVVWLIVCAVRGAFPERFLMFHIMQSVFLSLCYFIVNFIFWHVVEFLSIIPFINGLTRQLIFLFNSPFLAGYSIMQCLIYGTVVYLVVFSAVGLYAYIPWISKVIMSNFRD